MDPQLLAALKTLTDPVRLRVLGRLAARPASAEELADELGIGLGAVVRHIRLLRRAGIVRPSAPAEARQQPTAGQLLELDLEALGRLGRALDDEQRSLTGVADASIAGPGEASLATEDLRVLRGYLEDGRLTTIPAHQGKRLVVLRWLREQVFTEDREYPEKEVNQRLAVFHPDVAALRRYMVDARLVARDRGLYRRLRGPQDPGDDASS